MRLKPWQLTLVRALIVHTYAPVGAGERRDKALFGETLRVLELDADNPTVASAAHEIANELIAREGQTLPPFALKAMRAACDPRRWVGAFVTSRRCHAMPPRPATR